MNSAFRTPDDARANLVCPLARTFGAEPLKSKCRGEQCAAWRWKPMLATDGMFVSAVKREMACLAQEAGDANTMKHHKTAVANVSRNPEGHGVIATEGYCGLGGLPT